MKILKFVILFSILGAIIYLSPSRTRIDSATLSKIDKILQDEELNESQIRTIQSISCEFLTAGHLNGEERDYSVANSILDIARAIELDSIANHGKLTYNDGQEARRYREIANKLIK